MEIKQQIKLSQQLVMTPQLQQAIRLLQLSRLELIDEIRKELDANPVLADEEIDPRARSQRNDETTGNASADVVASTDRIDRFDEAERNRSNDPNTTRTNEKTVQDIDWEQFLENR